MRSNDVNVFEGQAHCSEYGTGPHAIICLHGNSSSGDAFAGLAEGLPSAFRLICVDFPGHGRSSGAESYLRYYSFQGLAKFVVELTRVLPVSPVAIVGHSMGGHVAAQLLSKMPSLQALLLISSPPIAGAASLSRFFQKDAPTDLIFAKTLLDAQIQQLTHAFAASSPEAFARIEADIQRTDGAFRHELGASLRGAAVEDELALIKAAPAVKISLLGGLKDRFIERGYYGWVSDRLCLDRQDALVIESVGHYPHLEAPRETHEFFLRFLKNLSLGTSGAA